MIKTASTTFNHHHNFITSFCKTRFCTFKGSSVVFRKSVRFKETIAAVSMDTRFIRNGHVEEHTTLQQDAILINNDYDVSVITHHQITSQPTTYRLHTAVNRLSKWFVAVTFGGFIILRRDDLALWAATGSVSNFILSITLKRILKQERPVSQVMSSGPGMPSSHAQTIFFTLVFVVMSMIERMGLNGTTTSLGILLVMLGSYFSWLRILLGYHTTSQVIAGMFVGSNFAVLWFWAWEAVVSKAYNSNLLVQILLSVGGVCYLFGFISYVLLHLTKD
ncbi:hypothetical protein QVD17_04973 [Tagetes erecta]|uniref:Phosphatidic acid phosphatase type 2/haloperoxidase domain-containing protein n=1 Tax=Tagetes erecta TaxID=13708 RepID=A0AAD8PA58_TARER|nr:hypothetical protein QVD17_04973 [Tagetes erecta]